MDKLSVKSSVLMQNLNSFVLDLNIETELKKVKKKKKVNILFFLKFGN